MAASAAAEDDAGRIDVTTASMQIKHIHHQAYACWDSEETRHFYEDILEMPLIATVVVEDPFGEDGSGHCYTFFKVGNAGTLAFFEQMSLVHPKHLNAQSARHRHVTFEVGGDATVRQFNRKLDAIGVAKTLKNLGTALSLRFNDPNGLILEFISNVRGSFEFEKRSRSSAHSELQRWLLQRENWWRHRLVREKSTTSRSAAM